MRPLQKGFGIGRVSLAVLRPARVLIGIGDGVADVHEHAFRALEILVNVLHRRGPVVVFGCSLEGARAGRFWIYRGNQRQQGRCGEERFQAISHANFPFVEVLIL